MTSVILLVALIFVFQCLHSLSDWKCKLSVLMCERDNIMIYFSYWLRTKEGLPDFFPPLFNTVQEAYIIPNMVNESITVWGTFFMGRTGNLRDMGGLLIRWWWGEQKDSESDWLTVWILASTDVQSWKFLLGQPCSF